MPSCKKYLLCENYLNFFHAGSKATNDVIKILCACGFEKVEFSFWGFLKNYWALSEAQLKRLKKMPRLYLKIRRAWFTLFGLLGLAKAARKIQAGATLFVQYPFITVSMRPEVQTWAFKKFFEKKRLTVYVVVHDLNGVRRENERDSVAEIALLKMAKKIVCHNEVMKNYLVERGIQKERISFLNFFDYLHEGEFLPHAKNDGVAFAGNIRKSKFLWNTNLLPKSVKFNLYGIGSEKLEGEGNVRFMGMFPPEELPAKIEGGFGLVWDGDSVETCNKILGEYLRLNSSHKNSLYIVSRLPIIIWKRAALAPVIEKMKIGFAVDALSEIPERIAKIDEDEYRAMQKNVDALAKTLEEGKSLLRALKKLGAK